MRNIALVCTRNRPRNLDSLLTSISNLATKPDTIVVVDSSDESSLKENAFVVDRHKPLKISHVVSLPGLPHQRNVGLSYIHSQIAPSPEVIISFLDDDIELASEYFSDLQNLFLVHPDMACIGGFDRKVAKAKGGFLRRIAGIYKKEAGGRILKSGIAIAPSPSEIASIDVVDWVAGHSMNVRFDAAIKTLFDGRLRMYGEDVEFLLRLSTFGRISVSRKLQVIHNSETVGRERYRDVQKYTDAFRWRLASDYPGRVSKIAVLWSTLLLAAGEGFRWLIRRDPIGFEGLLGHLDFLRQVALRIDGQQFVEHPGSGPFSRIDSADL